MRVAIEDLEALKELNDELEENHVEAEKQLNQEIGEWLDISPSIWAADSMAYYRQYQCSATGRETTLKRARWSHPGHGCDHRPIPRSRYEPAEVGFRETRLAAPDYKTL
jgi:hypothetical protein